MRLLTNNNRVIGTATDDYTGSTPSIQAPADFDLTRIAEYTVTGNAASLPAPPTLAELKAAALVEIDRQLQFLYNQSIVNAAIKDEYNAAYQSATAWIAAPLTPVPPRVAALAAKFGITNLQAANVVKSKTDEGNAKLEQRGAARLTGKAQIESATSQSAITAALQAGVAAMAAVVFVVT